MLTVKRLFEITRTLTPRFSDCGLFGLSGGRDSPSLIPPTQTPFTSISRTPIIT